MDSQEKEAKAKAFLERLLSSPGIKDPSGIDPEYLAWLFQFEEQTRAFMVNAQDYMIYRLERDDTSPVMLRVVFLSPSAKDVLGLEDPYRLEDWFAITHPEDVERMMAANIEAFSSFRLNEQGRIFNRKKGEWRWVHAMGTGSPDITGLPMYANGIIYDITEQKQAELALKDREERLSLAIEASNAATYEFHFDDFAFYPDSRLLSRLSLSAITAPYTLEKLKTRLYPDDQDRVEKALRDIHEGSSQGYDLQVRILTDDNRWIWIQSRGRVVARNAEGLPCRLMGIVLDITERKTLEDRLQQVYRMEAVGTLAAGIAHDFNNILSPIMGFAELASEELQEGSPARESVSQIMSAAKRAQDLVKQILTVGRQYVEELRPLHLQPVLRDAMRLIRASVPSTIGIRLSVDDSCGRVMGDATQLTQVILNLCTNAYQAMQATGGTLSVTLAEEKGGHPQKANR
ncbi:MAG: PAS domain-containing protein [Thermodesulfobacteriota bacterium]